MALVLQTFENSLTEKLVAAAKKEFKGRGHARKRDGRTCKGYCRGSGRLHQDYDNHNRFWSCASAGLPECAGKRCAYCYRKWHFIVSGVAPGERWPGCREPPGDNPLKVFAGLQFI